MLARSLRNVVKSGQCKVISGVLDDPYSGATVEYSNSQPNVVVIDHLIPLARAWALGAWGWNSDRRATFANDEETELVVTTTSANSSKGDKGPGRWLPQYAGYRCTYATKYILTSVTYQFALTNDDKAALARVLEACP